jgi:hypothetical protein
MTADELLPIFRDQFPEFNLKSDDEITLFLNNAIIIHAICEMATVYLAAHIYVINDESGVGGSGGSVDGGGARETASESAKSVSASFKSMAQDGTDDSFYTTNPYGRMYVILRNSCPGKRFSVRVA